MSCVLRLWTSLHNTESQVVSERAGKYMLLPLKWRETPQMRNWALCLLGKHYSALACVTLKLQACKSCALPLRYLPSPVLRWPQGGCYAWDLTHSSSVSFLYLALHLLGLQMCFLSCSRWIWQRLYVWGDFWKGVYVNPIRLTICLLWMETVQLRWR